jgi:hypothetical protein
MADPRTKDEITKIPKRTHIDFFIAIIISSYFNFKKLVECYKEGHLGKDRNEMLQRDIETPWSLHIISL